MTIFRLVDAFLRRDLAERRDARGGYVRLAVHFAVVVAGLWHLGLLVPRERLAAAGAGGEYLPFALLGVAAMTACGASGGAARVALLGERTRGTLEFLLLAPVRPAAWIVAGSAAPLAFGLLRALVWGAAALVAAPAPTGEALMAAAWIVAGAAAAYGWGLVGASLALRGFPSAATGFAVPALLGGVLFPVDLFPLPLRLVSYCLPVTHAAAGARAAIAGEVAVGHIAALALLGAAGLAAGGAALGRTLRRMRVTGDFT